MFKNFFKLTLRNLLKNKTYSFLNIFGLAIGITCAGLIFLWVEDEMHFDQFNVKKDRLYFARVNTLLDARVFTHWSTPGVMGPAIQAEIPGIANTCRSSEGETSLLFRVGEKSVYAEGKYAEAFFVQHVHPAICTGQFKNCIQSVVFPGDYRKNSKEIFRKRERMFWEGRFALTINRTM